MIMTINVTNCRDCPYSEIAEELFSDKILCSGGTNNRVIGTRGNPSSVLLHKTKVHETCPFGKLDINVRK